MAEGPSGTTGRVGSAGLFPRCGVAGRADATSIGGVRRLAGAKDPGRLLSRQQSRTVPERPADATPRRPALFLDRDGIVNEDRGYVHRREDVAWIDGIFDLAAAATRQRLPLVIVTNQSGIGRGLYTEADFHLLMRWIGAEFARRGTPLARVEVCPDHPTEGIGPYRRETDRRKPGPGMLRDAAAALGLDLAASIMIGDALRDVEAGQRAGLGTCVLVTADAALAARAPFRTLVLPSVRAAAAWLAGRR